MDTSDPLIRFDSNGICNYYYDYFEAEKLYSVPEHERESKISEIVRTIKENKSNKEYDCLIGISGGVDSTFLALKLKQLGLNPLGVHFDNGWNSETAIRNIENLTKKLDIDLYTYIVDWKEFKDLQLSYLKSSVIDIEVLTDHAINATLYRIAKKKNINFIISGYNIATEYILPDSWIYKNKSDVVNLKAIHKKFGTVPLKSFPTQGILKDIYYRRFKNISSINFLNYISFNVKDAKEILRKEIGWVDYGGKHFESIFTRFYQGYILPTKFKVDKRRAHLSTLICSGQITRDEALQIISTSPYSPELLKQDMEYVLKKLDLSKEEFDKIMNEPPKDHTFYPTDLNRKNLIFKTIKFLKTITFQK